MPLQRGFQYVSIRFKHCDALQFPHMEMSAETGPPKHWGKDFLDNDHKNVATREVGESFESPEKGST